MTKSSSDNAPHLRLEKVQSDNLDDALAYLYEDIIQSLDVILRNMKASAEHFKAHFGNKDTPQ